jgi:undecaprenyl-diphosphatase
MDFLQIAILALVQGAAELLPVSSSAHVIAVEKLMNLDPSSPEMTMLLVMLHTGTMFAVILYFWRSWKAAYFGAVATRRQNLLAVVLASLATAAVGLGLQYFIKHVFMADAQNFEIEQLFGNAHLMAAALACAGLLIIFSSFIPERANGQLSPGTALLIGSVQGLCLPFRGFSRSGATISTGLAIGVSRRKAEEFSFALAVALTPAVIVKEAYRLAATQHLVAPGVGHASLWHLLAPGLVGMALSFVAGLGALRWLSSWLESGHWHIFGAYCLAAAGFVLWLG